MLYGKSQLPPQRACTGARSLPAFVDLIGVSLSCRMLAPLAWHVLKVSVFIIVIPVSCGLKYPHPLVNTERHHKPGS